MREAVIVATARTPIGKAFRSAAGHASLQPRSLVQPSGLIIDDIGLWELNEAFAGQLIYCRDRLGIPNANLNVSGGA